MCKFLLTVYTSEYFDDSTHLILLEWNSSFLTTSPEVNFRFFPFEHWAESE